MSHTTEWKGLCYPTQYPKTPGPTKGRREATVSMHHNGNPANSNVRFFLPNWIADVANHHGAGPDGEGMAEVHIPFEAIKSLVLNYYRNQMIDALEYAEDAQLEELLMGTMLKEAEEQ